MPLLAVVPQTASLISVACNCSGEKHMEVFTAEQPSTVRNSLAPTVGSFDPEMATLVGARMALGNQGTGSPGKILPDDSARPGVRLHVLLVEDSPADVELELLTLRKDGLEV